MPPAETTHVPAGQVEQVAPRRRGPARRGRPRRSPRAPGSRPLPVSAPVSRPSAGSITSAPRRAQRGDVGLGGGVLPHLGVHRRGEHHRAAGGEQGVGEQVVGQAVRGLGQQVGGGRGDHDQVGGLADPDVRHLVHVGPDVGRRPACRTAPPRSGAPTNSSAAAVGHDGDVVAGLGEPAQQLAGLVRSDAAAHAQDDARLASGVRRRARLSTCVARARPEAGLSPRSGRRPRPRGRRPRRSAGRR